MARVFLAAFLIASVVAHAAAAGNTPISSDSRAYIVWPKDGAVIHGGKFWVRMGVKSAGIAPAGTEKPNTGHHHLIIDAPLPPLDREIPADKNHLHFGAGQTEVRLELPPGKHTLQLLFADHEHVPHNPPVYSEKISITVP